MIEEGKWEESVVTLAKHKMLEKMEELNKEEHLSDTEVHSYKNAAKTIYYLMSIEKAGGLK